MAGSYTVVILPLHSSLHSLDALRFFLWLKRLKELEREKDCLWTGLQVLEQGRLWYEDRLLENRERQGFAGEGTRDEALPAECCWHQSGHGGARHAALRGCIGVFQRSMSRMQRVNGSLGNLMCDPKVAAGPCPEESWDSVSNLRWQNTLLIQEVSEKSREISRLEQERDGLLQQLDELEAS